MSRLTLAGEVSTIQFAFDPADKRAAVVRDLAARVEKLEEKSATYQRWLEIHATMKVGRIRNKTEALRDIQESSAMLLDAYREEVAR